MLAQILKTATTTIPGLDWALVLIPTLIISALIMRLPAMATRSNRLATQQPASAPPVECPLPSTLDRPGLSEEHQWQRVTDAVQVSLSRAAKAQESHAVAARHLDVVAYEIDRIVHDLHVLMPQLSSSLDAIEPPLPAPPSAARPATGETHADPQPAPSLPKSAAA